MMLIKLAAFLVACSVGFTTADPTEYDHSCQTELNNGLRDCCASTGVCKDSSCVVFGFKNSAKANCPHDAHCPGLSCRFVSNCRGNKCYGTVVADSTVSQQVKNDYEGKLCLRDGDSGDKDADEVSTNFKICDGACSPSEPADCPNGRCVQIPGRGKECVSSSPSESPSPWKGGPEGGCVHCDPDYRSPQCKAVEHKHDDWFVVDVPGCTGALYERPELQAYGCERVKVEGSDEYCDSMVCKEFVPDNVVSLVTACTKDFVINTPAPPAP